MADEVVVYVELLDEAVDAWRPVTAIAEGSDVYRLPNEKPSGETWAFAPGTRACCRRRRLSEGDELVAYALAD